MIRPLLILFTRGWLIVFLVSANTVQIAGRHYLGATIVGALISLTWWYNAHAAAHVGGWRAAVAYALGAALGTLNGMQLMGWWYG